MDHKNQALRLVEQKAGGPAGPSAAIKAPNCPPRPDFCGRKKCTLYPPIMFKGPYS